MSLFLTFGSLLEFYASRYLVPKFMLRHIDADPDISGVRCSCRDRILILVQTGVWLREKQQRHGLIAFPAKERKKR